MALANGDDDGIRSCLLPSAVLTIDSGGVVPAVQTPVEGRDRVIAGLRSLMTPATSVRMTSINGIPGLVLEREGLVIAAVTAESSAAMLSHVWVVCNPDKLRHWNRR
nr:hypothetical protein [uncultured Microbacterium sp.]